MSVDPVTVSVPGLAAAFRKFGEQMSAWTRVLGEVGHRLSVQLGKDHGPRCRRCHPRANPRPLAIDGHAYRRRVRARRGCAGRRRTP